MDDAERVVCFMWHSREYYGEFAMDHFVVQQSNLPVHHRWSLGYGFVLPLSCTGQVDIWRHSAIDTRAESRSFKLLRSEDPFRSYLFEPLQSNLRYRMMQVEFRGVSVAFTKIAPLADCDKGSAGSDLLKEVVSDSAPWHEISTCSGFLVIPSLHNTAPCPYQQRLAFSRRYA